ncbi:MAG: hypothetical protein AB1346_01660 [Thermodesulfobacteriota bacterium]
MATMTNRDPARRLSETSSLMGVLDFHPRPAVVLAFLTITLAVVGWRIFRDAGAPRFDALTDEAIGIYAALPAESAGAAPVEIDTAEKRILEISGVPVQLPRDAAGFVVTGLGRETVRKRPAAALRFRYDTGSFLLIVFRPERFLGGRDRTDVPEESLLSGEKDGRSYVLWEREKAAFIMVSDVDVIRAFGLVRRFFT